MAAMEEASSSSHHHMILLYRLAVALAVSLSAACRLEAATRALFVFGDSLVDNGNNNFLATTARADSPPYGIDYPTHLATGRFSNGLTIPDIISEYLGAEYTMPYLSPELRGEKLLVGANFASAGVGILNDTGLQFLNVIKMTKQLEYFEQYQRRVASVMASAGGAASARRLVNDALVLITVGGNDFINNYYLVPYSPRSHEFSLPDYVDYLVVEYKKILSVRRQNEHMLLECWMQRLYELGARRVLVTGAGPLGCTPAELAFRNTGGECYPELQRAAALFNARLVAMIGELNSELGVGAAAPFVAANVHHMYMDFINSPQTFGFETSRTACCGEGPYNGLGLCTVASKLCPDRDLFFFWDLFHPTERASRLIVRQMFEGSDRYMTPMNISAALAIDAALST